MKSLITLLAGVGIVTALAVGATPDRAEKVGVVTFGPTQSPDPTPRVRVSNFRLEPVDILYLDADAQQAHRFGRVAPGATSTFRFPEVGDGLRFLVLPITGLDSLLIEGIDIGPAADVALAVTDPLDLTTVEVEQSQVVWSR